MFDLGTRGKMQGQGNIANVYCIPDYQVVNCEF